MNKTIIAPVGDQPEAIYPALREFTVEHVHLITAKQYQKQAKKLKKDLQKFGIPYSETTIGNNLWEDTFTKIAAFAKHHPRPEHIIVHVGVGDRNMQCAATSASFVNGLHAVNGNKDMIMGLPIMKFSYYTHLNERKIKIMRALTEGTKSLNDLSQELRISLSLLSYHIHGNRKSEGLIDMGVIELEERNNQTFVSLSAMGRLLLKGDIPQQEV